MRTAYRALLPLLLASTAWCTDTYAQSGAEQDAFVSGKHDERDLLAQLRPALYSAGLVGRLYYSARCESRETRAIIFPQTAVRPDQNGQTGLARVQSMFGDNKNVALEENPPGTIRVRIGNISDTILRTKISVLNLTPIRQYNAALVIDAIMNSNDVKNAMQKLGVHREFFIASYAIGFPQEGQPHFPPSTKDESVDELLDTLAKVFKGVAIYGACEGSGLFDLEFVPVAGSDYYVPSDGAVRRDVGK